VITHSGDVGIGTTSPGAKLDVAGNVLVGESGTSTEYDVNFYGGYNLAGNSEDARFFWDASKGALRAGSDANLNIWDDTNVGLYSIAMGFGVKASGIISTAIGFLTTASGDVSVAMGDETTASGDVSVAMGGETIASGNYSTAMGYYTTASGLESTAMGVQRWEIQQLLVET